MDQEKKKKPQTKPVIDTADYYTPLTDNFDVTKDLRADKWEQLSLNDLWHQKILLQDKINFCNSIDQIAMVEQMTKGMMRLQALIEEKSVEEGPDKTVKFRW